MKRLLAGLSAALLVAATVIVWIQYQSQEKLRAEINSLTEQNNQLKSDAENLSNQIAQAKSSQAMSKEQFNELLKLRGEVGGLRNQAGQLGKMRAENQQLRAQTSARQSQSVQISPGDQFKLTEWHTIETMKQLGLAMRLYQANHNDAFATNFDQFTGDYYSTNNYPNNIGLDAFEFVNVGVVNDEHPEMIMFREKNPRQTAGGRWVREYGMVDGSVQTIYSDGGNFSDYEKQHSPPPANQ